MQAEIKHNDDQQFWAGFERPIKILAIFFQESVQLTALTNLTKFFWFPRKKIVFFFFFFFFFICPTSPPWCPTGLVTPPQVPPGTCRCDRLLLLVPTPDINHPIKMRLETQVKDSIKSFNVYFSLV